MKLTSKINLILGAVVLATCVILVIRLRADAGSDFERQLARDHALATAEVESALYLDQKLLDAQADTLRGSSILRALFSSGHIDNATVLDSMEATLRSFELDEFILLADGVVRAHLTRPQTVGTDMSGLPAVTQAVAGKRVAGLWTDPHGASLAVIAPLALSARDVVRGQVLIGRKLSRILEDRHARLRGANLVVEMGGRILGSTFAPHLQSDAMAYAGTFKKELDPASWEQTTRLVGGSFNGRFQKLCVRPSQKTISLDRPNDPVNWLLFLDTDDQERALSSIYRTGFAGTLAGALVIFLTISLVLYKTVVGPVKALSSSFKQLAAGDRAGRVQVRSADEIGELGDAFNNMARQLAHTDAKDEVSRKAAQITKLLQGARDLEWASNLVLAEVSPAVGAKQALLVLRESVLRQEGDAANLVVVGTYALAPGEGGHEIKRVGQGLLGQAVAQGKTLSLEGAPPDFLRISSGLGQAAPVDVLVTPIRFEGVAIGAIEVASLSRFGENPQALLEEVSGVVGILFDGIASRVRTERLLGESRVLTLQLQEQARLLVERAENIEQQNVRLGQQAVELEARAEAVAQASRYKSEFLANMSHELRTPLNSMLILSRLMSGNTDGNLTDRQIQKLKAIHGSGKSLLDLVNDILDLSKIDAGRMELYFESASVLDMLAELEQTFRPLAEDKAVTFEVVRSPEVPTHFCTDVMRVHQVLRNLIGNAIKFTREGRITLTVSRVIERPLGHEGLDGAAVVLAFAVSDTGIGIPASKVESIFQAFQQGDGSTSRKYGGTGLGLSISSNFAALLGGRIQIRTKEGVGSTFTLQIPERAASNEMDDSGPGQAVTSAIDSPSAAPGSSAPAGVPSQIRGVDSGPPGPGREARRPLMIVEDDPVFAGVLADMAIEVGLSVVHVDAGDRVLERARRERPVGILMDLSLPGRDGWSVLEELKADPLTRSIPVHVISGSDDRLRSLKLGAVQHLVKPASRDALLTVLDCIGQPPESPLRRILHVEDDPETRRQVEGALSERRIQVVAAETGEEALELARLEQFDGFIVDLGLPDTTGFDLIESLAQVNRSHPVPMIVYTGRRLEDHEMSRLRLHANSVVLKSAHSLGQLTGEVGQFIAQVRRSTEQSPVRSADRLLSSSGFDLTGLTALVVDDDPRNVFAVVELLEAHGLRTIAVGSGAEALLILHEVSPPDVVLTDIMMPEMDGFQLIHHLRQLESMRNVPIVALTAKALAGDREACLKAGANHYVTKPIDEDVLLRVLWQCCQPTGVRAESKNA